MLPGADREFLPVDLAALGDGQDAEFVVVTDHERSFDLRDREGTFSLQDRAERSVAGPVVCLHLPYGRLIQVDLKPSAAGSREHEQIELVDLENWGTGHPAGRSLEAQ